MSAPEVTLGVTGSLVALGVLYVLAVISLEALSGDEEARVALGSIAAMAVLVTFLWSLAEVSR